MIPSTQKQEVRTVRDQLYRINSILSRSLRRFWIGGIVIALGTTIGIGIAVTSQRKYVSKAVLLYRQMIQARYLGQEDRQANFFDIGTQLRELVLARPVMTEVIKKFDLYPDVVNDRGFNAAVDMLRKFLDLKMSAGDTFHIEFQNPKPDIAQGVVAWLTEFLIEQNSRLRTEQASTTVNFLQQERKRVQNILDKKEMELAKFLSDHPEFVMSSESSSAGSGSGGSGASIRKEELRKRLGDPTILALQRQIARIKDQIASPDQIMIKHRLDPKTREAIEQSEQAVQEAQANLSQKESFFTEMHPDVQRARRQLDAAKQRLNRIKKMAAGVHPQTPRPTGTNKEALQADLANLNEQLKNYRAKRDNNSKEVKAAQTVVSLEVDYARLNREATEIRARFINLEGQQFKASLAAASEQGGQASQLEVIDPAFLPNKPAGIGRTVIVVASLAVSMMFAGMIMLVLGFIDDRLYDRLDIANLNLGVNLIVVPKENLRKANKAKQQALREARKKAKNNLKQQAKVKPAAKK